MRKELILFFVISLFFISGQAGCESLYTAPGGTPGVSPGISTVKGGNGLNVDVEPIGSLNENDEFYVYIMLTNYGKAVEPSIKLWSINKDLGVLSSPEEDFVSFEDARVNGRIEKKEEEISFGPYIYTNLKSDVNTNLIVDVSADYSVEIIPPETVCIAKRESKLCSSSETISKLGDEASAVPITVTNIKKTYRPAGEIVNLDLEISLADAGQGYGLNDNINNFDVSLTDGTRLKCNVGDIVNIKELKEPVKCSTKISLGDEEASSYQVAISFNYNYLIRQSIPISVKAIKKEYLT